MSRTDTAESGIKWLESNMTHEAILWHPKKRMKQYWKKYDVIVISDSDWKVVQRRRFR